MTSHGYNLINVLRFVDFKKAFDFVNQDLLLYTIYYFINDIGIKLFADDYTFYLAGKDLNLFFEFILFKL
jgi:hypothetical protein